MATVTYKHQPGIHATRGSVPLAGTSHLYTVSKVLWPTAVEEWIADRLIYPTLHVCCGLSRLGDVRLDMFSSGVDVRADAARLPFSDGSFATVLIDPPYNGKMQWNHDMLNELHRVAHTRVIFQHWFSPINERGEFKKAHSFKLTDAAVAPYLDSKDVVLAVKGDDGLYATVEDQASEPFYLTDMAYWQPRSYFGRVQIISVLTKDAV